MSWKFAVFTVMCPEFDVEQTAALAAEVGMDGLEWRATQSSPEPITQPSYWSANRSNVNINNIEADLARAKSLADRHGLALPMLGTYMSCDELPVVEAAMRACAAVGCTKLRVGTPRYDGAIPYPELFDHALQQFEQVAAFARQHGVQACIEMHMGNITPSAGLAHRLVSSFDPAEIGVIFDPGNMVVEGFENYQMGLELLGSYLSHVHAKNMAWERVDGKWRSIATPMAGGQADWRAIVTALKVVGYEGWFSFEDFTDRDTRHKLTEGLAYLKELEVMV